MSASTSLTSFMIDGIFARGAAPGYILSIYLQFDALGYAPVDGTSDHIKAYLGDQSIPCQSVGNFTGPLIGT